MSHSGRYMLQIYSSSLSPHAKSWLIGKDSDAGRDWGQEEKGTTEDEMAGWYHRLDGRESEWTPGVGDWQGGLVCCDSWGRKESNTTERLIWSDLITSSSWSKGTIWSYSMSKKSLMCPRHARQRSRKQAPRAVTEASPASFKLQKICERGGQKPQNGKSQLKKLLI